MTEGNDLERQIREHQAEIRQLRRELRRVASHKSQALLEGLIAALDYRDAETQWHSRRVSLYARRLAQQLGIREPELTVIEQGALLHDIGKIGVRDGVLLKAGKLSDREWFEMRRHPELGWALLQRVEHLRPASSVVLQHHEHWDGTGYPAGLSLSEIVLGARIFAVVDTLDAMTSDRPYRRALGLHEVHAEVARCAGSQFDPEIVGAFLVIPGSEWERIRMDVEAIAVLAALVGEDFPDPAET